MLNKSVLEKEISANSDNTTNNELSIEQEKEKNRADTLNVAVKEKKKASRNIIYRLRAEYNEILDLNLTLPKDIRLCSESFNSNLVMLRSRKVTLLEYIRKNNNRMRKINIILNEPASSLKLREPSYT